MQPVSSLQSVPAIRAAVISVVLFFLPALSIGQVFYTITDIRDEQKYKVVHIGDQWWMAENLNTGKRIDNSASQLDNDTIEKYCPYDDESYCNIFGGLYLYDELMQYGNVEFYQGLCPSGWYVPSDGDWKKLEIYLGMSPAVAELYGFRGYEEGGMIKSAGTSYWRDPNLCATDNYGFSALPAGFRDDETMAYFGDSIWAVFWCADSDVDLLPYYRILQNASCQIYREAYYPENGFSCRCVKYSPYMFGRGEMTDPRDDEKYATVLIGNHWWMAENLNVGTWVDTVTDPSDNGIIQKYCYNDDGTNCDTYGGMYLWNELMNYNPENKQGICPDGWHVPSDDDWKELEFAAGMPETDLDKKQWDRGSNEGSF